MAHTLLSTGMPALRCTNGAMTCAVAHVKNEQTGKWWRFDDEAASVMERGPVGENSDHGVAALTDKSGAPAKVRFGGLTADLCTHRN